MGGHHPARHHLQNRIHHHAKEVSRLSVARQPVTGGQPPAGRRLILDAGGTCARVLDLACPRGHPDHGAIIAWHAWDIDFRPDTSAYLEKLRIPPPGCRYDLVCPDCPSKATTFLGLPDCIEAAFGVLHSESCPWLHARLAGAR